MILAGGGGTRLWPLSRKNYPKQFLKIYNERSLLRQTADRLLRVVPPEDLIVMSNNAYRFYVKTELGEVPHMILEPECRNTAPAIALGMKYCREKLGCTDEEVIFLSPSDHVIKPDDRFAHSMRKAGEVARRGHIVTFGVKPDKPETGYGYLKGGTLLEDMGEDSLCLRVEQFTEKPDSAVAERYFRDGSYFWNSGMFAFSIGTMEEEMRRHVPEIGGMLDLDYEDLLERFERMPDISIDYAVVERSDRVVVLPFDAYWNDIGSWDSLYEVMEKDGNGNVTSGDVLALETRGSLILGSKRQISTIGIEDCLIVETSDALLVAKRGNAQKVKEVVTTLRRNTRTEAEEHVTTHRPWGTYTVLENGPRYKIKRIMVKPGEQLSLQMHYHRSEHWVVVRGTAKVTIGDTEVFVHENESAYVPKSTLHRLENPGKVPLEIIEVQNGEYVGEDDIVRVKDVYGR